jgi:type VI protein secretion system component Hcp
MPGSTSGRSGGEAQISEMTVSMPGASSIPTLTQFVLVAKTVDSIIIEAVTASANPVVYQKWTLTDCAFSNIAISDSGVGLRDMGISLSISFTNMQFDATAIKDDGSKVPTKSLKYDVAKKAVT